MTHPRSSRYAQKKICLKLSNTNLTKNPFAKYLGDFLFVNANVTEDDGVCVVRCSVHLPLLASWLISLSTAVSANYQLLLCVNYSSFLRLIVNNVAYFSLNFAVHTNIGILMFEWSNHGQYEASDVSVFFLFKKNVICNAQLLDF